MSRYRKLVLLGAALLFAAWAFANLGRIGGDDDAFLRIVLVSFFAFLILVRTRFAPRTGPERNAKTPPEGDRAALLAGLGGAGMAVVGIVVGVHQFEWLGLVLVLYGCLRWALPPAYRRDILLAMFLLYWMHPLPGQVFSRFQFWMQLMSVQGAEWLLHGFNIPVWADGFYLYTGFLTLGVPEACSGMRAAMTVVLCTLGVGLLMRLRWLALGVLVVAGIAQVLALNIFRIALIVRVAPEMPREWAETVLHDSLGVFLLVSILLVQFEVSWWRVYSLRRQRLRDGRARGELEKPDRGHPMPGPWRLVLKTWKPALLLLLLALGVVFAYRKQRSGHRLNMLRPVIEALLASDPATAEKAITAGLALAPGDRELLTRRAHVLLVRGKYEETLDAVAKIPTPHDVVERVMRSRALMALGRVDEAFEIASLLAETYGDRPGVAMLMAEYGAAKDQPERVARHIVVAARSHLVRRRAQALFPYLALREQWEAIAACDNPDWPFDEIAPALVAVHARLRTRNTVRASQIMEALVADHPGDPLYLGSLFSLASSQPGSRWETLFAQNLRTNIHGLPPDRKAVYIDYAFRLSRPDLAWLAWLALARNDPNDPALFLAVARFRALWFAFRRHQLRIEAGQPGQLIDLSPVARVTRGLRLFDALWDRVPEIALLRSSRPDQDRAHYLDRFFAEIEARSAAGTLTERMALSHATGLGMAGRYAEAHARLNALEQTYPPRRRELLFQRAGFYNQEGRWDALYETLMAYRALDNYEPRLDGDLMLINAMMNLNLGVGALEVAREAAAVYPGSPSVTAATAAIWDAFQHKAQALFVAMQNRERVDPRILAQLFYDTGRFVHAERVGTAYAVGIVRDPLNERQRLLPVPAELALARRWPRPMDAEQLTAEAERFARQGEASDSSFVSALREQASAWCRAGGVGDVSDPAAWLNLGRHAMERAMALHQLVMLQARQQRYDAAAQAVELAVAELPDSPVLRRIQIVLAEGDETVVEAALAQCPDDPEIWLAALVTRWRRSGPGAWLAAMLDAAVEPPRFSAETMTRAAFFLLQQGQVEPATRLARRAMEDGEGLVSAYVVGLHCALAAQDVKGAVTYALTGAELARDPTPFFRTVVLLKWREGSRDADVVKALQFLRSHYPDQSEWSERLGFVYFEQQENRRALSVLGPVIDKDARHVRVQSLLTAAESARLQGDVGRALEILEAAYAMYPDRVNVLNNLIYTLLEHGRDLERARELLPGLLAMGSDRFAVLDTAAMVYLRSGDMERAQGYMRRALDVLEPGHRAAAEVTLNAAELYFQTGDFDEARRHLKALREFQDRPAKIDNRARELMQRLDAFPK